MSNSTNEQGAIPEVRLSDTVNPAPDENEILENEKDWQEPTLGGTNPQVSNGEGLRNENADTQFKEIKGKKVRNAIEKKCSRYISAFANYEGGVIYFGINDQSGEVVGVDLSNLTTTDIDNAVKQKIGGMFYGQHEKLIKGEHWDIQYFDVEKDGSENIIMPNRKIITLSVCRIPGGVFTETPESYYVDNDGNVQRFTLQEWRSKMIASYAEKVATKGDIDKLREDINRFQETIEQRQHDSNSACMDGAGKSQLAQKYANEQREQRRNYIVWKLNCQNADLFQRALEFFSRSLQCNMHNPYFTEVIQSYGHTIASELAAKCQKHSDLSPILILDDVTKKTLQNVHVFLNQLRDCPSVKVIATTKINPGMSVRILEVHGFTEDESCKFLSIGKYIGKQEEGLHLDLARKISCNPLGLFICQTFMTNHRYSIEKMNRFVDAPCKLPKIENVVDTFEGENKIFQCLLNVLRQIEEDDKDIFELLLVLIFLDTHEEVPVILLEFFSQRINMADDFIVEKFLKEITNASFGTISGYDDFRSVKTHQVIIRALELDLEANYLNVLDTKRKYLQRLLESFMMLISQDNRTDIDLRMNKLIIPHAIVVVKHGQELLEALKDDLSNDVIDFQTPLMYVNQLIGYTFNVEERVFLHRPPYLSRAKQLVFSLVNVEEAQFECTLQTDSFDISEAMRNAEQILEKLDIFQNENTAYHSQIVKWFVVGKRRSKKEMECIHEMLNRLTFSNQVTEEEYTKLVKRNKALCFNDMQSLLFIELVVSVFDTYGRQMFYLDDVEYDDRNSFLHYLKIAYCISSKIKERNPNIYWERICKTSGIFKFVLLDPIPDNIDEYWQKMKEEFQQELMNVNECRYYQFGLLKNDEQLTDKVILLQLFAEICISLYQTTNIANTKKSLFDEGQAAVDSLIELKEKLINFKTFNSVLSTIAKWYSCIGNKENALQYFKHTKEYHVAMDYEDFYQKKKEKSVANNTHSLVHSENVQQIFLRHGFHIKNAKFFEAMKYLLYPPIQTQES